MEDGARVRVAAESAKAGVALRVPCGELLELPATRLHHHPATPFLRRVLESYDKYDRAIVTALGDKVVNEIPQSDLEALRAWHVPVIGVEK